MILMLENYSFCKGGPTKKWRKIILGKNFSTKDATP
jgi:hypothetical protein